MSLLHHILHIDTSVLNFPYLQLFPLVYPQDNHCDRTMAIL